MTKQHGGSGRGQGRKTNKSKGLPTAVKKSVSLSGDVHQFVVSQMRDDENFSNTTNRLLAELKALRDDTT